jgi:hypothetical protein
MTTGIKVSKAIVYSVVGPPTGVGVSKAVVYSVIGPVERSFLVFLLRMIADRNGQ